MKGNLGLNLDGIPSASKTGDYRYAENVVLDNTFQFPMNEDGLENIGIDLEGLVGVIPFDKGFVTFCTTIIETVVTSCIRVIKTNFKELPFERTTNTILIPQLEFITTQPIRGTTTYNQNGHLVVAFSCGVNGNWEDKIIDIDSYGLEETHTLNDKEFYQLDITPNVKFPKITNTSIAGSLLTGSYQIAVSYKIGKEYTNYSLLSLPYYIYGHNEGGSGNSDGLKPNSISTEGINYTFENLDTNYDYFRIAVIYNNGTSFIVKTTPDIATTVIDYNIKDLEVLDLITLDETLINSIFYSNSETLNVMNNRLYRANLKGLNIDGFDEEAQQLANNVSLSLNENVIASEELVNLKSKQFIKFQSDEVYALYLTLGDKKGNVIGSYPIHSTHLDNKLEISYKSTEQTISKISEEIENSYTIESTVDSNVPTITKTSTPKIIVPNAITATALLNVVFPIPLTFVFDEANDKITITKDKEYLTDFTVYYAVGWKDLLNSTDHTTDKNIVLLGTVNSVEITISSLGLSDYKPESGFIFPIVTNVEITAEIAFATEKTFVYTFFTDGNITDVIDVILPIGEVLFTSELAVKFYDYYSVSNDIVVNTNDDQVYLVTLPSPSTSVKEIMVRLEDNMEIENLTYTFDVGETSHEFTSDTFANPLYFISNLSNYSLTTFKAKLEYTALSDVLIIVNVNTGSEQMYFIIKANELESDPQTHNYPLTNYYTNITPQDIANKIRYKYTIPIALTEDIIITDILCNDQMRLYNLVTNFNIGETEVYSDYVNKSLPFLESFYKITNSIITTNIPILIYSDVANCYSIPKENIGVDGSDIKYTTNNISIQLPILDSYSNDFKSKIGFWCIHRAQRTNNNSKIYTQGVGTVDVYQSIDNTKWVDTNPKYINSRYGQDILSTPHVGDNIRFYSFEDLYNKNDAFPLGKINSISRYDIDLISANSGSKILYTSEKKYDYLTSSKNQILLEGNNLNILNLYSESTRRITIDDKLDVANNTDVITNLYLSSNFFTHYLGGINISDGTTYVKVDNNIVSKFFRCNIFNQTIDYYKYLYNEVLILCSPINLLNNSSIIIKGDTFYSSTTFKFTRLNATGVGTFAEIPIKDLYDPIIIDPMLSQYSYTFFIESKYNVHARYWEGDYPKYDQPIKTGEQVGYDKVYNLENKENIVTPIDYINNTDRKDQSNLYPTRIIKSTKSNLENNQLNFRKFLALDYFDMPYNRGEIKALHSTYKNLYVQQELALAIASIKDVISYQDGTTYVGSGELFDRQPIEIIPTGFGFAGCEDYFNCGMNDRGYWAIDNVQGIIILVTDTDVKLISEGKNKNWFKKHLHGNNPFIGDGCYINYDTKLKRFILTIGNEYTISYVPEIENWLSFHFYKPLYGIYTRNKTLMFIFRRSNEDKEIIRVLKYNESNKGFADDVPMSLYPMILSLYYNEEPEANKLWESLYWDTKLLINDFDIYDKTFTGLTIHNDTQCCNQQDVYGNIIPINVSTDWTDSDSGVYKEELWIFNKLFDYVKDNHKPFLSDFINFINTNFDYTKEWFDISKLMSIFVCVTFYFDNLYYSIDGKQKSLEPTTDIKYKPTILLKDLFIKYKHDNR